MMVPSLYFQATTAIHGALFGSFATIIETGTTDPSIAIIGAIAGAVGSLAMLVVWARLITKAQSAQNRNLIDELAAERSENARLRAEARLDD